jgi:hypothetical protein
VYVERFGTWPDIRITLRNVNESAPATTTLVLDATALGLPGAPLTASAALAGKDVPVTSGEGGRREATIALGAGATEVLRIAGQAIYLPLAGP